MSATLKPAAGWRNSTLNGSNVVEEVRKLKEQPGKNILTDGSSVLIHTPAENDLVDEYDLHVYPLVLGSGKRLFPEGKVTIFTGVSGDEPSIGLHPRDVHRLNELLQRLRDKGNTVMVVEHDPDVIKVADHIKENFRWPVRMNMRGDKT